MTMSKLKNRVAAAALLVLMASTALHFHSWLRSNNASTETTSNGGYGPYYPPDINRRLVPKRGHEPGTGAFDRVLGRKVERRRRRAKDRRRVALEKRTDVHRQQQLRGGIDVRLQSIALGVPAAADGFPGPGRTSGRAGVDASLMVPPQTTGGATEVAVDQPPLAPLHPAPSGHGSGDSVLGLLDNFKDSLDPYDPTATPMFWHIPKAGGSSIKDVMGGCHKFVQATEFGVTDGHLADAKLAVVHPAVPGAGPGTYRSPFVNVDTTTIAGIERAKTLGFADAHLAQVVVSPFVFQTNDLFTQTAKGRLFAVFRHPIDRAISLFHYLRIADWEPTYSPELKDWTLERYAVSNKVENNWMTRMLSNQPGGELTEDNLAKAMEVVRTKFVVGLTSKIEPTMSRFEKFFRWTYRVSPPNQEKCRERLMSGGGANSNKANNKNPLVEGDPGWYLLARQNDFDLRLYSYIEKLFEEQEALVAELPDEFRNVDATCCKCSPKTFPPEGFACPEAVKNEG